MVARHRQHIGRVDVERDWSHIRVEIECTIGGAAQPLGDILAVTQTAGKGQDTDCLVKLGGNVPESVIMYIEQKMTMITTSSC